MAASWLSLGIKSFKDYPMVEPIQADTHYTLSTNTKEHIRVYVNSDVYIGETREGVLTFKSPKVIGAVRFIRIYSLHPIIEDKFIMKLERGKESSPIVPSKD